MILNLLINLECVELCERDILSYQNTEFCINILFLDLGSILDETLDYFDNTIIHLLKQTKYSYYILYVILFTVYCLLFAVYYLHNRYE